MIECPKCQAKNHDTSRFCSNCAAPLGQGAGAGPDGASVTRTLETPIVVLKPGSLIASKYKIIEEIGAGGLGVVCKAEDLKLKRCVALKFLPPQLMESLDLKERFLIEAQAAALSHPNICVIHEVGESEDRPYIAMEYVEGETLREAEAHSKGIIYRDISPQRPKDSRSLLNGRYDTINRFETTIKPAFDLLETPAADKKLMLYDTDHIPPVN